jgi:two-component system, OmpR family, phosphate regulon sensor histidine kinase PhoR
MPADATPAHDPATLYDGLSELLDLVNTGDGGPAALQLIVDLAAATTGAAGATLAEYGPSGGRTVAATTSLSWALGRPVDMTDPGFAKLLAGPPAQEAGLDQMPRDAESQLRGYGLQRMLVGLGNANGSVVVSLHAFPPDPTGSPDPRHLALVRLLAAIAAHLYRDGTGLPVHSDGPALTPVGEGLVVVGPDGTVRSWSPAAERVIGRTAAEAIGAPLPFPVPRAGQAVVHRLESGRWIHARSTPLVGIDATLVTFRESAESRDRDQTRDLFISMTSHELRTPVTVIKGYADTLVERWDSLGDTARREAVFVLWQRAGELARLVDRLLNAANDMAALRDGPDPVPFDPAVALRHAAADLAADLRRSLQIKLPETLPKVRGDRASLTTVLTELVTNACKYSPEWVEVELTAGSDAQTVWIRVSDRGSGIRPEHTERAFERFWQLERNDQRRYGGVGLGLYLVRRIVERQNGWVSLRPRHGGGTVAEVRLPRADTGARETWKSGS